MEGKTGEPVVVTIGDRLLREDVERIVAATGRTLIRADSAATIGRQAWSRAAAIVLDGDDAAVERLARLPRRPRVVLVGHSEPSDQTWRRAVAIGAEHVLTLPVDETQLVSMLSGAAEPTRGGGVISVMGGRGGAGASVFSAALGLAAPAGALVIDADPLGGGIDLLLGCEDADGLRWTDINLRSGHIGFDALRRALPAERGVTVLSGSRSGGTGGAEAIAAVIDSARAAGVLVVVDLPRRVSGASGAVLERADLVVVVTPAEVRACASSALVVASARSVNPNVGLVVRGPAPGGLRAADIAALAEAPLLAAMRPEPNIGVLLDNKGLRMARRSPLRRAAEAVLALVTREEASRVA